MMVWVKGLTIGFAVLFCIVLLEEATRKPDPKQESRLLAKQHCKWHKGLKSMHYAPKADRHGKVMVPSTLLMKEVVCRDGTKILTNWEVY